MLSLLVPHPIDAIDWARVYRLLQLGFCIYALLHDSSTPKILLNGKGARTHLQDILQQCGPQEMDDEATREQAEARN
jgi:hypothetical protein